MIDERRMMAKCLAVAGLALSLLCPAAGWSQSAFVLTLKDHKFTPDRVTAPAGQRFRFEVVNNDDTVEEFESYDLKLEKIIVPGGRIVLHTGPLKPGQYKFFGDYHPDQAVGFLDVVAP